MHFDDLARGVLHDVGAGHEVGAPQAHFLPGDSRKNFFGGTSAEIVALDVQRSRENGTLRVPAVCIFRVVDDVDEFFLTLGTSW